MPHYLMYQVHTKKSTVKKKLLINMTLNTSSLNKYHTNV